MMMMAFTLAISNPKEQPMTTPQLLIGHVSPETAYVSENYPYGFRLRCTRRSWIEYNLGRGYRYVVQTSNPKKGGKWNAPKKSTYAALMVMCLDQEGHVQHDALPFYPSTARLDAFVATYGPALQGEQEQLVIEFARRSAAQMEAHTYKATSGFVTYE
jgi:hypothetical protein